MEDKDLFEGLKDRAANFQLPYEEGEWELFCEREQKKKRFIFMRWVLTGIAASILLIFLLLPEHTFQPKTEPNKTVQKSHSPGSATKAARTKPSIAHQGISKSRTEKPEHFKYAQRELSKTVATQQTTGEETSSEKLPEVARATPPQNDVAVPEKTTPDPDVTITAQQLATIASPKRKDSDRTPINQQKDKTSNWDFGLEVQSALSDRVQLGAGVSVSYRLSPKISINSGLALIKLGSANHYGNSFQESAGLRLTGTSTSLSTIDIPLTISYYLNKKTYILAGISGVRVLAENKQLKYLEKQLIARESVNPETGLPETQFITVEQEVSKQASGQDFIGNNYPGFLQFGIGRQIIFSKSSRILAEPYLKIPVGRMATGDANLFHGGFKLKLVF